MSDRGSAATRNSADASAATAIILDSALQLFAQGRLSEAAPLLQQVLRTQPDHTLALHRLGNIAAHLSMPDRATRLMRQSLRAGGQTDELLNDLGGVYVGAGDLENARRCFQRCIDAYPRSSLGYVSLAYVENESGSFERAERLYETAIEKCTETFEAEFNLATLYRDWGHLDRAIDRYDQLIATNPDVPLLTEGRARARLQQKCWSRGWEDYEARFLIEDEPSKINLGLPIVPWRGESLKDSHLLVLHEQGIGDEVQFASCYADAIADAATCTITCSPRLRTVFQAAFPAANFLEVAPEIRERWAPADPTVFDFFIPAGSLPKHFRTSDERFPGTPFLNSEPRRRSRNQARSLRVGLSWWGGAVADQIKKRSVPLELMHRLFDLDGIEWINCQHGRRPDEEWNDGGPLAEQDLDPYRDLETWFKRLQSLDLLISVDNSNVHFAGALGIPTWLLLPRHPNWRWPEQCDHSPWYNCVELIRQEGDWSNSIDRVKQRLIALSGE